MRNFTTKSFLGLACSASSLAIFAAFPTAVSAQDTDDNEENVCEFDEEGNPTGVSVNDPNCEVSDLAPQADGSTQTTRVVITGSRIQRDDTYSSISPLQVLDTETLQDTGQFDAAAILQQSESAAGQQIDATFQGFVLNNGPGSQTLNLRGLGADRTLLLINGRRLAPAGVEGAPTNPSINLIPSSLVARYDLLLDGASSVYGSDAVAGVGNIVLRRDIDGLELFASGNLNEEGAGNDWQVSGAYGMVGDNWNFGIGAEFSRREEILLRDRSFLAGCNTDLEITQDGQILTQNLQFDAQLRRDSNGAIGGPISPCKLQGFISSFQPSSTRFGFLQFDADGGNTGIPNFSFVRNASNTPIDADGDGLIDIDPFAATTNAAETEAAFISPQDLYNVMAYGEYSFGGDFNITPFFEANYSRAEVTIADSGQGQFFPFVPATNPFNPCNFRDNPNGVDCRAVSNRANPQLPAISTGFLLSARPVIAVDGDRDNVATVQEQYRGVVGIKGDLPFIDFGPGNDWTFEIAGVYSRSEGSSVRRGIREDRLALSLGIDPTADFNGDGIVDNNGNGVADDYISLSTSPMLAGGPCDSTSFRNPNLAPPGLNAASCVPVNLFAPSLYDQNLGSFATQAEFDYLIGERTFDTTYEQTVISAYVQGSIFELPGGTAKAVLGAEYRDDTLTSLPDIVASDGLFWGFFADQGAIGSRDIYEAFGEIDLPLLAGETLAEEVRLNLSGRITEDEFYGTNGTYSVKLGWRPFQPLLLKLSYGTSFRSPNLRELFLAGQSGFGTINDPCAVPQQAFSANTGGFNPALDTRDQFVLDNCVREGRDPTRAGILNGLNTSSLASAEITSGGSFELDPETSDSFTTGLAFAQAFGPVDFSFNFNYYNISLKGAIVEPSGQFVVNQCFLREETDRSNFCDFLQFDQDPLGRQLVSEIFAGFLNVNEELVEGIDLNANFSTDISAFGKDIALGLNVRANHLIARDQIFITDDGVRSEDSDAGEFGFPSWTGRATFSAQVDNVAFTFQTRMIGETSAPENFIDPFVDAFGGTPDGSFLDENGNGTPDFTSQTCLGSGSRFTTGPNQGQLDGIVAGDGVFCRNVFSADAYFVSSASVRVDFDWFQIRLGVSNIFDRKPPLIDTAEVFGISNTPIGNGYDLDGREYFGSISVRF